MYDKIIEIISSMIPDGTGDKKDNIRKWTIYCITAIIITVVMLIIVVKNADMSDEGTMTETIDIESTASETTITETATTETATTEMATTETTTTEPTTTETTTIESSTEPESEDKVYSKVDEFVYSTYRVNVRETPDGRILGSIAKGAQIKRIGIGSNNWSRVEYNGQIGYISSTYLETR